MGTGKLRKCEGIEGFKGEKYSKGFRADKKREKMRLK